MGKKGKTDDYLYLLIVAIFFFISGIYMLIRDLHFYGIDPRYMQLRSAGGFYILFVSIIFFICTYFSLSPYHPVRTSIKKFIDKFRL